MNKSQLKFPLTALILLLPVIALVVCFKLSPKDTSAKLINNVDTVALFKIFDRKPYLSSIEARCIWYQTQPPRVWGAGKIQEKSGPERKIGVNSGVLIGVFPTIEAAHHNFLALSSRAVAESPNPNPQIGSEFKCWYGPIGRGDREGGHCLLRRDNCIFDFPYEGTFEEMIALARKVDAALQSEKVAQRGEIEIPQLVPSAPKQVRTDSRFRVMFKQQGIVKQLLVADSSMDITKSPFSLYGLAPKTAGPFTKEFLFSTQGNVLFSKKVQSEALNNKEWEASHILKHWELHGDTLYFSEKPNVKWWDQSPEKREWLKVDAGNLGPIYNDEDLKEKLTDQAREQIKKSLNAEWVSDPELLTVGYQDEKSQQRYSAYASYSRKDVRLVVMVGIGKSVLVYFEQPTTAKPLELKDVVRPELLKTMNASPNKSGVNVLAQKYRRYRATSYKGPFQPVQILLTRIGNASQKKISLNQDDTLEFMYN